ncbi:hypothetical protein I4U23_012246 [Adineta vaga]|nr:hypothetical protein I4U23_012246 [Adineta vaga]
MNSIYYIGYNFLKIYDKTANRQLTAPNDLNPGDTLSLYISSEQRLIRLKNLTRNRTLELPIDLNKCALPWQLKIVISTDYYQ